MNNISKFIDHTLLAPAVALADIEKLCEEAVLHQFASVCIPPIYVENALKLLQGTGVMLGSVAGFPFGYSHMTTKVEETKRILDHGADEVDVVVNLTLVKNQDWKAVRSELDSLATVTSLQHQKVLKIILETALLTEEEIIQLCNLCGDLNVGYVKTSTGYSTRGASIEDIKLIKKHVGEHVKIKASGGIKTYDQAVAMIDAGASRIGTSSGIDIIKGNPKL